MGEDVSTARGNAVLDLLTDDQLRPLLAHLQQRPLHLGAVLFQPGEPVTSVWFPLLGVTSVLAEVAGGEWVEVATIGREGVVGLPVFLGAGSPTERCTVQVAGTALAIGADAFREQTAAHDGPLHTAVGRYAQAMFTQLARNAACNRVHTVRQRAARSLLMTADRMDGLTFDLTQDFLAQMLAVRRPTVNELAQALADDGVISYSRGVITILDRDQLHAAACDCYDVISDATRRALRLTERAAERTAERSPGGTSAGR